MPHDALNRRLRYHRKRTGKRIAPTERDTTIFALLRRYRYLRSTFIHAFVGGCEKRLIERLGDLFHEGYLNRPPQQWQAFNARYAPAVYELDALGEAFLRERGEEEPAYAVDLVAKGRMGANRQFAHALMICDTLSSIELGVRQTRGVRFISWQEILARAPESTRAAPNPFAIPVSISYTFPHTGTTRTSTTTLIPDGLFGLAYAQPDSGRTLYRFFALEAERTNRVHCSNLEQTSWLRKVLAYREITAQRIYHSHLGLPNLMVLVVTPTDARIETMTKLIMDITEDRGSTQFLLRSIPVLGFKAPPPTPELFVSPWRRAGHPAFEIARA